MVIRSKNARTTEHIGAELAREVARWKRGSAHACVIALSGDLGSGKTTFVRGFLRGIGVKRGGQSPTFVLMRTFAVPARKKNNFFTRVSHIDAYRMKGPRGLSRIRFSDLWNDPKRLILIEWPERARLKPSRIALTVLFSHGATPHMRTLSIRKPSR